MAANPLRDHGLFTFGNFTLHPRQRLLFRGTEVVALEPQIRRRHRGVEFRAFLTATLTADQKRQSAGARNEYP